MVPNVRGVAKEECLAINRLGFQRSVIDQFDMRPLCQSRGGKIRSGHDGRYRVYVNPDQLDLRPKTPSPHQVPGGTCTGVYDAGRGSLFGRPLKHARHDRCGRVGLPERSTMLRAVYGAESIAERVFTRRHSLAQVRDVQRQTGNIPD